MKTCAGTSQPADCAKKVAGLVASCRYAAEYGFRWSRQHDGDREVHTVMGHVEEREARRKRTPTTRWRPPVRPIADEDVDATVVAAARSRRTVGMTVVQSSVFPPDRLRRRAQSVPAHQRSRGLGSVEESLVILFNACYALCSYEFKRETWLNDFLIRRTPDLVAHSECVGSSKHFCFRSRPSASLAASTRPIGKHCGRRGSRDHRPRGLLRAAKAIVREQASG